MRLINLLHFERRQYYADLEKPATHQYRNKGKNSNDRKGVGDDCSGNGKQIVATKDDIIELSSGNALAC